MKRILALMLAVLMVVCLVACGTDKKNDDAAEDAGSGKIVVTGNATADPEVLEYAKLSAEQIGTDTMMGMKISLEVRGTSLVYVYRFIDVDSVSSAQADSVEENLEAQFEETGLMDIIKSECPAVQSVIYEYYESDGDLILHKEFR